MKLLPLVLVLAVAACAPRDAPVGSADSPSVAARKVLRVAVQREPAHFLNPGTQGQMLALRIADAELTVTDSAGQVRPSLAAEVPSIERGTWKLAPDGTMEVAWRLRDNLRWHDGQPMTADDLVFGWEYLKHPNGVIPLLLWLPAVEQVSAPEPLTLIVHFKSVDTRASVGGGGGSPFLRPIPRHILGAAFAAGDVESVNNSAHWRDEFVGLGPYQLTRWDPGSRMQFARFDQYFLGRPPLDGLILSFFPDTNALVANILAGEVDVHPGGALGPQQAVELRRRWEGTGNQVLIGADGHLEFLAAQFRPEVDVRPAMLRDRLVRQALYRAIDRQAFSEGTSLGLSPVADSWIPPEDLRRQGPAFRDAIMQYPFDPVRAERDLGALGWRRGPDGILTNQASERFEFEIRNTPSADAELALGVLADSLRRIGVSVTQTIVSPQLTADREYRALYSGMELGSNGWDSVENRKFHSREVGTPANRYGGTNKGGYVNSQADELIDRLTRTIEVEQRNLIIADLLRLALSHLPILPLQWNIGINVATARVKNVLGPDSYGGELWNLWQWDISG